MLRPLSHSSGGLVSTASPQYGPSLHWVVHLPYVLPAGSTFAAPRSHCSPPTTYPSPQLGTHTLGAPLKPCSVNWKSDRKTSRSAWNTAISYTFPSTSCRSSCAHGVP